MECSTIKKPKTFGSITMVRICHLQSNPRLLTIHRAKISLQQLTICPLSTITASFATDHTGCLSTGNPFEFLEVLTLHSYMENEREKKIQVGIINQTK